MTLSAGLAQLALYGDEVRILIFDDPAENERGQRPEFSSAQLYSKGFKRKGARVRIITFRVTTRLQSKSNRCI